MIRKYILQIYLDYGDSLGAYNIRRVLERDYGILISLGRVYRLMNTMNPPSVHGKTETKSPRKIRERRGCGRFFGQPRWQVREIS